MTTTAHLLTGAALATKVTDPALGIPLALASHYLGDLLPHWDPGADYKKRSRLTNFILFSSEAALAFGLILFLFLDKVNSTYLLTMMIAAILPDILELPYLFEIKPLIPFFDWHVKIQHFFHRKAPFPFGLLTQSAFVIPLLVWSLA